MDPVPARTMELAPFKECPADQVRRIRFRPSRIRAVAPDRISRFRKHSTLWPECKPDAPA